MSFNLASERFRAQMIIRDARQLQRLRDEEDLPEDEECEILEDEE
jgi:hypothetical protein